MFTDEPMDLIDAVRPEDDEPNYSLEDLAEMCGDNYTMKVDLLGHYELHIELHKSKTKERFDGNTIQQCVKSAVEFLKGEGE